MTSSMLAGERKWASSRRGGMTVLGKVAVPKPINLPSQKLENHGLDPNVEIVPKGSLSWGSRPSSSTSNPWGSSAVSPKADGTAVSPHHSSGRPTSGGGLSRPSTAGSDRHDPSTTTWGPNSRPSSASGVLTSNQSSLTSSRPLSAETRPGSSHLSRFAEPVYDSSAAWGPNGTADKLSIPSKVDDFSLSSGDFPTLGSEKDNTTKSGEAHDHGSRVRPGSGSGRNAPVNDRNEMTQADHKSGTVDTWTRDDGVRPNADRWHGDSHQYVNPNVPPQHYDAWRGPPMNAPPGVWYRGPPPAGPPYPHVPHGGFPMEPGGVRGPVPVGNMYVSEQLDSHPPEESSHGPYKVLKKRENERNADVEEDGWEQSDHPRPSFHKNEQGTDTRRNNEDTSSRRNMSSQDSHKSKASTESWGNKPSFSEDSKDSTLIQKIEDLNAKVRASDIRGDGEQTNKLLVNPKGNSTIAFGSIPTAGDLAHPYDKSRQAHHGVRNRADHHIKGRLNQDTGESLAQMIDPADGQAQRARMRELAKQRAIELQKEEEERIREQKAKALAKLEELNRRTLAASDGTIQTEGKNTTSVSEQEDAEGSQKPTEPAAAQISEISQQDPVDQSTLPKQSDPESKTNLGNDVGVNRQKRASHRQKQSVQVVESSVDKSNKSGTGEAVQSQESTMPSNSNIMSESTQQKKKSNKSSKNKHREVDPVKPESPQPDLNPNPTTSLVTDSKDAKQPNTDQISSLPSNQHKPQHSRRMPRNPQANKFHVGEVAIWAPVRAQTKEETMQDDVALPEKTVNSGQTNLKSKRAEMERYVPKPVAKELAQQGSVIQSTTPSSPKKTALEDTTDVHTIPVASNVESKSGDNKQMKPQRDKGVQQDSKKVFHKSTSQHEESNSVPTEVTPVVHEWDPSDGWFMPDEIPPTEITPVVKDVGVTGKGKRPAYKGQRSTVKNHTESGVEVEFDQTDRPASSKENRSSHWQRKPQAYKGQNPNSEFKRESRRYSPQDEPVHDEHQEGRRERKPASFRGPTHTEDEAQAQFEQPSQHHVSTGYRKYGGQNNRSSGQDDKRKHNYQHNANINREKPRQNLHYEYQPVGSNNNNSSNKSSHLDAPADAAPRYKERGPGQSRRGGGNYYGRQ
ncbi:putative protein modifier of SNC1 1 [Helianthus annuus]|nr:putative protein modifier of SNC1 1 [Helianthus annuus]